MLYSNPHGGSRDMAMIMAYLFSTEFGKKQSEIAQFLGVSQSTVHQWIKEISYKKTIRNLERELEAARQYIGGTFPPQGGEQPLLLPPR